MDHPRTSSPASTLLPQPTTTPSTTPPKSEPYWTPPPPRRPLLPFLAPALLTTLLATLIFICELTSRTILSLRARTHSIPLPPTPPLFHYANETITGESLTIHAHFYTAPSSLILGTSCVVCMLVPVACVAVWVAYSHSRVRYIGNSNSKGRRIWTGVLMGCLTVSLVLVVATVGFVFVQQVRGEKWDAFVRGTVDGRVYSLTGTRETWLCELKKDGRWAVVGCGFARTARWGLVPLVVACVGLAGVGVWVVVRG
ncbi:hypothetical protein M011DRAFT_466668 [Sporormia fimetaria CBS 119925]|uniref:Uncharacterized protein n=1 Tax=Sporormia fimetaria CBS 119925 TaxID=1340428 RepID=A0A6A6VDJ2_9PLEO|nr:hypothetical protein M011DRAFT_466668 [Sporormia fimetaria CBS 119925]